MCAHRAACSHCRPAASFQLPIQATGKRPECRCVPIKNRLACRNWKPFFESRLKCSAAAASRPLRNFSTRASSAGLASEPLGSIWRKWAGAAGMRGWSHRCRAPRHAGAWQRAAAAAAGTLAAPTNNCSSQAALGPHHSGRSRRDSGTCSSGGSSPRLSGPQMSRKAAGSASGARCAGSAGVVGAASQAHSGGTHHGWLHLLDGRRRRTSGGCSPSAAAPPGRPRAAGQRWQRGPINSGRTQVADAAAAAGQGG